MMVVPLDWDKILIYGALFTIVYKDLFVKKWRSWLKKGKLAGITVEKCQELTYPYKVISFPFFPF